MPLNLSNSYTASLNRFCSTVDSKYSTLSLKRVSTSADTVSYSNSAISSTTNLPHSCNKNPVLKKKVSFKKSNSFGYKIEMILNSVFKKADSTMLNVSSTNLSYTPLIKGCLKKPDLTTQNTFVKVSCKEGDMEPIDISMPLLEQDFCNPNEQYKKLLSYQDSNENSMLDLFTFCIQLT